MHQRIVLLTGFLMGTLLHAFDIAPEIEISDSKKLFASSVQFRRSIKIHELDSQSLNPYLLGGCSAAKISERKFLTAAHCAESFIKAHDDEILILRSSSGDRIVTFAGFKIHPNFYKHDPKNNSIEHDYNFDVGIVTLKESTPEIPIARLAIGEIRKGQEIYVGGYGHNTISGNEGILNMDTRKVDRIDENCFLFDSKIKGKFRSSLSHGDSGGPAYAMIQNHMYIIGVNSYVEIGEKKPVFDFIGKPVPTRYSSITNLSDPKVLGWIKSNFRN